jgi:hypothetical protein
METTFVNPAFKRSLAGAIIAVSIAFCVTPAQAALNWNIHEVERIDGRVPWFTGIAYGDGLFLVIEDEGRIYHSRDAEHWELAHRIPDARLRSVIFAAGKFVVTGWDTAAGQGLILISDDGLQWTRRLMQVPVWLAGSAYGQGQFLVVGDNLVFRSIDGLEWAMEQQFVGQPEFRFRFLTYSNGQFTGTAARNENVSEFYPGSIVVSEDGISWDVVFRAKSALTEVVFERGNYIAVSESDCIPCGRIIVSSDGSNWSDFYWEKEYHPTSISYGNGLFVSASYGFFGSKLLSSRDGTEWHEWRLPSHALLHVRFLGGRFIATGGGRIVVSEPVEYRTMLNCRALGQGKFELTTDAPEGTRWELQSSPDLRTWTRVDVVEGNAAEKQTFFITAEVEGHAFYRLSKLESLDAQR